MRSSLETVTFGRGVNSANRKMLVLESRLNVPSDKDCESGDYTPLEEPRYSRFVLTIIDKNTHSTITPFCNIPAMVVDEIVGKYREAVNARTHVKYVVPAVVEAIEGKYGKAFAMLETFLKDKVPADSADTSAPYTARFPFGAARGKTIPEIVGDSPTKKDVDFLAEQKRILEPNVSAYPANKVLIREIDRAIKEIQENHFQKNNTSSVTPAPIISIYDSQNNYLKSRVDAESRVLCYGIQILCELDKDMPWVINIFNGYCPMEIESKTGRSLPKLSAMDKKIQSTFRMSDEEASYFFNWMERNRAEFISAHYPEQLEKAKKIQAKAISSST